MNHNIKKRQHNIDFIRGITIILVIIGHAIGLLLDKNVLNNVTGKVIYDIIYSFHMPLFFSISGYVYWRVNCENKKTCVVLLKDIIALYVPYLFINYVYWFEKIIAKRMGVGLENELKISLKAFLELLYIGDGITWFLLSLLLIRLICDISLKYLPDYVLVIFFSIIFWLSYCGCGGKIISYLSWGLFFIVGYLVNKYSVDKLVSGSSILLNIILVSIICSGIVIFINLGLNACVKLLIGESLFVILVSLTRNMNKKVIIINFIGENSIVMYTLHAFLNSMTYLISSKFIVQPIGLIISMTLLQIFIFWLIYQIITRVKIFNWCQFFFYPTKFIRL